MLTLSGKSIESHRVLDRSLFKLSTNATLPSVLRPLNAYLMRSDETAPSGFMHYFVLGDRAPFIPDGAGHTLLSDEFSYLGNEDILQVTKDGQVRVLYRAASAHNSIFLTEQCNNYCLMCSQPPKQIDDSWMLKDVSELITLIPKHTKSLGITGGEPTLFGDRFVDVLRLAKNWLPHTSLHLLSNGRSFSDSSFADKYASIQHPDLMVGIPIYSDDPARHDYVVQARGAFDETIRGVLNLKRLHQKVEIRVVIHKQTYKRLPELAEFIARNLLFVDHVALMGLEIMGFTRANFDSLWIDPIEYKDQLSHAVNILSSYGIVTSIYNHQLCLVNPDVEPFYAKSISDWKNEYLPECDGCSRISECGGFFSSGVKYARSAFVSPFKNRG